MRLRDPGVYRPQAVDRGQEVPVAETHQVGPVDLPPEGDGQDLVGWSGLMLAQVPQEPRSFLAQDVPLRPEVEGWWDHGLDSPSRSWWLGCCRRLDHRRKVVGRERGHVLVGRLPYFLTIR